VDHMKNKCGPGARRHRPLTATAISAYRPRVRVVVVGVGAPWRAWRAARGRRGKRAPAAAAAVDCRR
jgi:hypothetical protein